MKILKKANFIVSLLIVLLIGSCSKEANDKTLAQNNMQKTDIRRQPLLTPSQIDSIGLMHNVLLERFLSEVDTEALLRNKEAELERIISKTAFMGLSEEYRLDLYRYIRDSNIVVEQPVLNYYKELETILYNNTSVSSVNNLIGDLCEKVKSDETISLENEQKVLVLCSIAKHSKFFWTSKSYGGSGLFESYHIEMKLDKSSKAWQNIVISDAFGGLSGGIGWCGAAVFGGPVGVAGFVGNILWGAASASLATWATATVTGS